MPFPPYEKGNISFSIIPLGATTRYCIPVLLFRLVISCQYLKSSQSCDIKAIPKNYGINSIWISLPKIKRKPNHRKELENHGLYMGTQSEGKFRFVIFNKIRQGLDKTYGKKLKNRVLD